MTNVKSQTLKQEFIFKFPHVDRVGTRFSLDTDKVSDYFDRSSIISDIGNMEPGLQNPERYYQGDQASEFYDIQREQCAVILKDNEAEAFLNGMLSIVDSRLKEGLVLGGICYREGVGWIAKIYETGKLSNNLAT